LKLRLLDGKRIKVPRFNEDAGFYASSRSSNTMKKIKSQNSQAEILLRRSLWKQGFRYRISNSRILGKPDIVFVKNKLAIFIDGDFWHGFEWEKKKKNLKSNRKYWIPKIERNIQRDNEVNDLLKSQGWMVIRFWEHKVLSETDECILTIKRFLS
jgi:DNA mismatch endonuclease (patch repair protein)